MARRRRRRTGSRRHGGLRHRRSVGRDLPPVGQQAAAGDGDGPRRTGPARRSPRAGVRQPLRHADAPRRGGTHPRPRGSPSHRPCQHRRLAARRCLDARRRARRGRTVAPADELLRQARRHAHDLHHVRVGRRRELPAGGAPTAGAHHDDDRRADRRGDRTHRGRRLRRTGARRVAPRAGPGLPHDRDRRGRFGRRRCPAGDDRPPVHGRRPGSRRHDDDADDRRLDGQGRSRGCVRRRPARRACGGVEGRRRRRACSRSSCSPPPWRRSASTSPTPRTHGGCRCSVTARRSVPSGRSACSPARSPSRSRPDRRGDLPPAAVVREVGDHCWRSSLPRRRRSPSSGARTSGSRR